MIVLVTNTFFFNNCWSIGEDVFNRCWKYIFAKVVLWSPVREPLYKKSFNRNLLCRYRVLCGVLCVCVCYACKSKCRSCACCVIEWFQNAFKNSLFHRLWVFFSPLSEISNKEIKQVVALSFEVLHCK